jgi:hypothetical protein
MPKESTTQPANKPVKTWKLKGVHVSVFRNVSEKDGVIFFKTSAQKVYKDGEEFKTTSSLGRDDLPVAQLLLGKAYEFILESEANKGGDEQA